MKKHETAQLLAFLAECYNQNLEVSEHKVEAWHELLKDLDFGTAKAAIKKLVITQHWPPNVSDIRQAAAELAGSQTMTALEAWGQVMEAVRRFGWPKEQEALEWLGPELGPVVRRFGWQDICMATEPGVVRGQFCRFWEQHAAKEQELAAMPADLRAQLQNTADRLALPDDGSGADD